MGYLTKKMIGFFLATLLLSFNSWSQEYQLLSEKEQEVLTVRFSNDGKLLASGGYGKKNAILWDVESKKIKSVLEGNEGYVLSFAFSPADKYIAAGDIAGKIVVSSVSTGYSEKTFWGHAGAVSCLAFSPDGKLLYSGSADKSIAVWDVSSQSKVKEIKEHKKEVSALALSPDGACLATGSFSGEIILKNTGTWETLFQIFPKAGKVRSLSFSQDGKMLAAGFDDKTVRIYNWQDKTLLYVLRGHRNAVYDAKFSYDGRYLASAGLDNKLKIWKMENGERVKEFTGFYNLLSTDFSCAGKLLATGEMNDKIKLWNIDTLHILPFVPKLQVSNVVKSKTTINIIQPKVEFGKTLTYFEKEITLKGSIKAEAGIYELWVNNREVPIIGDNDFAVNLKLAYNNNPISIKAVDRNGQVTEQSFTIQRQRKEADTSTAGRDGVDYALIIATDSYEHFHQLSNPVNDGATVAKELEERYGFKTTVVKNPSRAELYGAIRNFSQNQYNDDDQLFIFIAGHGEFDPVFSEGYIVTKDSKANDEVKESFISHSNLRSYVNNIPCKHILIVMDVCFGGTFDDQYGTSSRGLDASAENIEKQDFIKRKLQYKTRRYLTSGGKEYVPDGKPGAHSPFARELLNGLRSNGGERGILTFNNLFNYVEKAKPGPKTGEFGANQPGSDFLFIYKGGK
jgi:WD40 repeat protein